MENKLIFLSIILLTGFMGVARCAYANNLSISNVTLTAPSASSNTINVQFDISWDHSWRNSTNRDAAWVFVKYSTDSGVTWHHATLKTAGTTPSGFSTGSGTGIDIVVPTDKLGAFIERSANGSGTVSTTSIQFVWDYATNGLSNSSTARVQVFGIEMCKVNDGSFYVGDGNPYGNATGVLKQGSSVWDPWYITSAGSISVTNVTSGGYYYVSGSNTGEAASGAVFTIPAAFPNGYTGFYLMKYEVTQGEYVAFLNTLTRAQQQNRVATTLVASPANVYVLTNTSGITNRSTVRCPSSGNGTTPPVVFSTTRTDRACNYLSWMDGCAFLDWAALRPITEFEYEKACRGTNTAVVQEMANGSVSNAGANYLSGTEDGTETVTDTDARTVAFGNTTWQGGDAGSGPVRVGIFAAKAAPMTTANYFLTARGRACAGYYGNMELTGNVDERTATIGNATGRAYTGTIGDGTLTTTASYEGNATNSDWPGIDGTVARGVTGATGSGFKGGNWAEVYAPSCFVSDRIYTAKTDVTRVNTSGCRGARTSS